MAIDTTTSELKALFRQSSHYLGGLLGGLGLGFISFPIFTRAFPVAEYGMLSLGQKALTLATAVGKLGMQNAVLRFYNGREFSAEPAAGRRYYSTMFFGAAATAAAATLVFLAVVAVGQRLFPDKHLATLFYVLSSLILVRGLSSILMSFLRIEERTKTFNALSVATKGLTILTVCLMLPLAGRTAHTYFTGAILAEGAVIVVLMAPLFRRKVIAVKEFQPSLFRSGIAFGLPLAVYELAFASLGSGDRFLVRHYLGAEALGQYSVAYGLSQYVNDLLVTPLSLALMPIYMRLWVNEGAEKTAEFLSVTFNLYLAAAAGVLAAAAVTCEDALVFLASAKYQAAAHLVPILAAGLLVYTAYVFVSAGLLIHKKTVTMAGWLLFSAAANMGLNCLLLPWLGLQGAAVASLLSYLLCVVLLGRASYRVLPLKVDVTRACKYLFAAGLTWLVASRISLEPLLLRLAVRGVVAVAGYVAVVLVLDSELRRAARGFAGGLRTRLARRPAVGLSAAVEPADPGSGV